MKTVCWTLIALGMVLLIVATGTENIPSFCMLILFPVIATIKTIILDKETTSSTIVILILAITSFIAVILSQIQIGVGLAYIRPLFIFLGTVLCFTIIVIAIVLMRDIFRGTVAGLLVIEVISIANHFVYLFRGTELMLMDIISIPTAMNVAGEYHFEFDSELAAGWSLLLLTILVLSCFKFSPVNRRILAIYAATLTIAFLLMFAVGTRDAKALRWSNEGSFYNGFLINFALQLKEAPVSKPHGYNTKALDKQMRDYQERVVQDDTPPDIIVIMNESFADLRVLGDLETDKEVMPFFDQLQENTIKGYCLASVFGGGTSCSEYEFLSGNTLGLMPEGCIPYQQYIYEGSYSVVTALEHLGYDSYAMHPYYPSGWNRATVYNRLGFNNIMFMDDFPQQDNLREFVSDTEMYEVLIEKYKSRNRKQPFFSFGVTIQNHGGWDDEYVPTVHIEKPEIDYVEADEYLSLIRESDKALKMLIDYFSDVDNDVILVFFGDHLPGLSEEFYQKLYDRKKCEYDLQTMEYIVPFLIWTNYDIEEKTIDLTSFNYLQNYMYEAAGFMPSYNRFLSDINNVIPAISRVGYYSNKSKKVKNIEDATGAELEAINRYELVQYNNVFDRKHHIRFFK